jgi:WD40 repeat protein
MRALSDDEERLVDASQTRLERDRRLVGLAESRALAAWGHRSLELGDLAAAAAFAFAALTRAATDEAQRLAHQVLDSPGRCLAVATGTDAAAEAMFSRDGSLVVTAGANGVAHIWAADSGILLDTLGRERQGFRVALSPDRYRVLVADEGGRPQVCSVETRETLAVLPWEDLDGNLAPPSTASLTFAAFSPRGWTLLTTWEWDEDEWAPGSEVWATDKGRRLAMLGDMGGEAVGRAAFSPDGRQWLTGHARGGNVRAWDLSWTHYQFEPFVASRAVTDCEVPFAFGPDGRCFLAAVRGGAALIRDFADLERRPLPSAGGEPAPLPDGASFPWGHRFYDPDASGGLGTADMGVEGAPLDPPAPLAVLSGHGAEILDLAFSPDGERVATGSEDGTARIWSTASGESMHVLRGHRDVVLTVCFSPDGDRLVTGGGDGTARVWSVTTGEEVAVLRGQPTRFVRPSFSPDGARVAAARGDSLRIWAVSPAESSVELRANQGAVFAARFEGDAVVTLSENREARRWSVEDGRTLDHIDAGPGRLWGAVLGPGRNGGALTWSEGGVLLWSESAFVPVHGLESVGGPDLGVVFHPDGDRYLAHYEMVVWVGFRDTPDVEAVGIHSDSGRILSAAFSEDGRRVITAGDDGTVRIWATIPASGDLIDAELVAFEAPGGSIAFAACDPGGRWVVTASDQGVASVLATESGEWVSTLGEHDEGLTRAVFSPDARRLLTVTTGGTVRVWDPATGELCAMFRRPGEVVGYASFSPDGQRVVTGSRDGTVRIWTALGQSLMLLRGHSAGITHAAFSDDGRSLVTSSNDGTARVWKVLDRDELLERVRLAVPRGLTPAELPEQLSETERSEVLRGSETGPQPARFQ